MWSLREWFDPFGITEFELRSIVYPNPFAQDLFIKETSVHYYKVLTSDGILLKKGKLLQVEINLSELSKGMYLLQLETELNTEKKMLRIIKH